MRYFYDMDYQKCLTEDELKAEFAEYSANGWTEAESAEDYIYNFLDYSGIEITEKMYNEFDEAKAVRQALDYLYSRISITSTEEEDMEAMAYMKAEWGF